MAVELVGMKVLRLFMHDKEKPHSPSYRFNDWICSLSLGAVQQASQLCLDLLGLKCATVTYSYVFEHFRIFEIDMYEHKYIYFALLMLSYDCAYYWFHRIVHEYHLLWALGHSVHHSGEDYNLACALRQGVGQNFTSWPFYLPLALLGFPPAAFAAHSQCNTLYQFWVHTEMVGRLGPIEIFFSTPAAHRMHHKPPGNCNYAGVFIIWDKMFGTYVPETERLDYFGLAGQPQTFNPLKLNSQHFQKMATVKNAVFAKRAHHKLVFNPLAVFKPMKEMRSGAGSWQLNLSGSRRAKFDGAEPMSWATMAFFVTTSVVAFVLAYGVLLGSVVGLLDTHETIWASLAGMAALIATSTVSDEGRIGFVMPALIGAVGALGVAKKGDILEALAEKGWV